MTIRARIELRCKRDLRASLKSRKEAVMFLILLNVSRLGTGFSFRRSERIRVIYRRRLLTLSSLLLPLPTF